MLTFLLVFDVVAIRADASKRDMGLTPPQPVVPQAPPPYRTKPEQTCNRQITTQIQEKMQLEYRFPLLITMETSVLNSRESSVCNVYV